MTMNMLATQRRSVDGSIDMSDLDTFTVGSDHAFPPQPHYSVTSTDDFGFDPPNEGLSYPKLSPYGPVDSRDPLQLNGWSGFDPMDGNSSIQPGKLSSLPNNDMQFHEMNRMIAQSLPHSATAVARFGQVTPPRSNSASSEDKQMLSPKTTVPERRKKASKAGVKEEAAPGTTAASNTGTPLRKRKSVRKSSAVSDELDDKRRQSLEKNRVAAAKCRINKKEKTEQLQRDSHEMAVHNAFLKEQVMRMKEEVQQMNAILLSHANCEGCKSPEEIQKHLSQLGNEFFAHHMHSLDFAEYSPVNMQQDVSGADFFGQQLPHSDDMLNPPLPEFDRTADFEVHTPMQTD